MKFLPQPRAPRSALKLRDRIIVILMLTICARMIGTFISIMCARDEGILVFSHMAFLKPVRTFVENSVHYQIEGDDEEWEALYPRGGIVHRERDRRPFTISMFHQLQCLDIIRREIVHLQTTVSIDPQRISNSTTPLHHHCVDYLRQMVLCRGDLELDPVFGKPHPAVIPNVYQCRDWSAVYKAVEENERSFHD